MIDKHLKQYLRSTWNEKKRWNTKTSMWQWRSWQWTVFCIRVRVIKVKRQERKSCYVQDIDLTCDWCAIKEQRSSFLAGAPMSAFWGWTSFSSTTFFTVSYTHFCVLQPPIMVARAPCSHDVGPLLCCGIAHLLT